MLLLLLVLDLNRDGYESIILPGISLQNREKNSNNATTF